MKLIDKNKLLEGLKNLKQNLSASPIVVIKDVESLVENLEVKEVDINKEISQFIDANFEKATIGHKISLRRVAKHFFELGLKAQKGE